MYGMMIALLVATLATPVGGGSLPAGMVVQQGGASKEAPIDVNAATHEELQKVPGIGPAMAQRIVDWREQHGNFDRLDDLLDVRGIGVKTLEKLRPFLTVGKGAKKQ